MIPGKTIRVLHVDDDPDDHFLIRDLLSPPNSEVRYELDWSSSYEEALPALEKNRYQACLLDYHLGKRNGLELVSEARFLGFKGPIIMLTGDDDRWADFQALEKGATDYLDKGDLSFQLLDRSIRYAMAQKVSEDILWQAHAEMELRVQERTSELYQANLNLREQIKERIKAENALRESKEYFKAIVENSLDIIAVLNPDFSFRFVSSSAGLILGYDPEFLTNRSIFDFIHPDDQERLHTLFDNLKDVPGVELSEQYRFRHRNGEWKFVESIGKNFSEYTAVNGIVVNSRDMTARRYAEEALQESEGRFRNLIEGSVQGILIHSDLKPLFINQSFAEIFGFASREEVFGVGNLEALFAEKDRETMRAFHTPPDEQGDGTSPYIQLTGIRNDGGKIQVVVSARRISWKKEPVIQATLIDVTERDQLEQQLRQAQKMEALGVLVAGVAHEINNPNSFILLNSSAVLDMWERVAPILRKHRKPSPDATQDSLPLEFVLNRAPLLLTGIQEGSLRIQRIVESLKNFARLDNSDLKQAVDLNQIIQSAIVFSRSRIDRATRRFNLDLELKLPVIKGNSQRIQQVVVNLLLNACDAMTDPNGEITVSTASLPSQNQVVLKVEDSGIGIPEEHLERIRDPFFTTKRELKGTGLGLSVSNGIIEEHGGRMSFESVEGQGTTVSVNLPYSV